VSSAEEKTGAGGSDRPENAALTDGPELPGGGH
jgi:hypothetical protein